MATKRTSKKNAAANVNAASNEAAAPQASQALTIADTNLDLTAALEAALNEGFEADDASNAAPSAEEVFAAEVEAFKAGAKASEEARIAAEIHDYTNNVLKVHKSDELAGKIKKIRRYGEYFQIDRCAQFLTACGTDADVFNKRNASNIYQVEKVGRIATLFVGNYDEHTIAIVTEGMRLAREGKTFSQKYMAYQPRFSKYSQGTLDTQTSSTLAALEMIGVVEKVGREYRMTDTPNTYAVAKVIGVEA